MRAALCVAILLAVACARKPSAAGASTTLEKSSEHFKIKVEFPTLEAPDVPRQRINAAIERNALRHLQDADEPKPFDDFAQDIAALNEEMRGDAVWTIGCICAEAHRTAESLVIKCDAISSMGGASYPNQSTNYDTYSLKDGHTQTLAEFVDPARHEALRKLVEADFRQQRGPDVEFDKLPLDDHFAPLKEGLVFHYSPGDVGPHALGETTVVIPWSAVKGI